MIRIVLQMLGMVAVLLVVGGVLAVLLCMATAPKDRQKEDIAQLKYLREYREKRKERKK